MKEEAKKEIMQMLEEECNYGFIKGYKRRLIDMICRKLRMGKEAAEIAEELDEDHEVVDVICEIAAKYAPTFDDESVFNEAWNI